MSLLYEKESYKIRGAAFNTYKELGCGHKETVYQKAFYLSLIKEDLSIEKEKRLPVIFDNVNVGVYIPDFLVNDSIIIELKAKPMATQYDVKQFWHYLKSTEYKLGFLINFGRPGGIQIIRRIYDKIRSNNFPRNSA